MYPSSYHAACSALIHCPPSRVATVARPLIARALRALRNTEGPAAAKEARRHFAFVNPAFIR